MIHILSIVIFLSGYIILSLERTLKISKTAISLLLASVLWVISYVSGTSDIGHAIAESGAEVFDLIIFLLSAMTLVEIITHYGFFDLIYAKLLTYRVNDRMQFYILSMLTFLFSGFLDNLTTTIVFLQIATRFFRGKNLLSMSAAIIIAANAGGAFSPIGDVTTTMLWLAKKFDVQTVVLQGFLPSLTTLIVSVTLLSRKIITDTKDIREGKIAVGKLEKMIIAICMLSFLFPLLMTRLHLPPYMGLLAGLGIVWLAVDIAKIRMPNRTSLSVQIEKFFQKTDLGSIYFFIGILLSVSALQYMGILNELSNLLYRDTKEETILVGNVVIGFLSAVFDNIPLTAAAIDVVSSSDPKLWVFLAYTVGVGGSILSVGSAPGIIAMSMVRDLSFGAYLKIATIPALISYACGILVWFIQYLYLI